MCTVLLVDDEAAILTDLQHHILWERFGVDRLFTAADGQEAWEIIKTKQVDLLVTDILMPHLDGLALLKLARERYPDIRCILLTAYGEFEYARAAIPLGVENYLLKPFKQDDMEETIEKALDLIPGKNTVRETDFITEQIRAFFQGKDSRPATFRELALTLTSGSAPDLQSAPLANLQKGILKFFAQEFPGEGTLKEQLDNQSLLSALNPDGKNMEDRIVAMLEYACLLCRYQYEQLSPVVRGAIDYIRCHYHEGLSIKDFSGRYKMNPHYLGFLFKKETGIFFNNYLTQCRISRSLKLLRDTNLKIHSIAQACGFSSTSYYTACFKRQTGLSPAGYRNLLPK